MRKLISLLLALVMVMGLATVAFAEEVTYTDMSTVTIDKTYTVTNEGTAYPDETFEFTFVEGYKVTEGGVGSDEQKMPTIGNVAFATANGTATKTVTINLPTYTAVGIYEYTIKETVGDTAGVVYHADPIKLVVTVIQEGNDKVRIAAVHTETSGAKSNDIENVYYAGSISVKKDVKGILGDQSKYFAITVSLTDTASDDYGTDYTNNVITVGETSYAENPDSIVVGTPTTFYLKHNETLVLGNIPYGTEYTITEANLDDYDEAITGGDAKNGTGTVDAAAEELVLVTNTKGGTPDTGIALDSIPFVVMMVVCAAAAVLFVIKRRSVEF